MSDTPDHGHGHSHDRTPEPSPEVPRRRMPAPARWLAIVLLAVVVLFLLFTEIFPRVEQYLNQDPTLGAPDAAVYALRSPR
ncbi:MAG: hypothetical protein ACLGIR_04730 [Actinomycetes bacterium]